MSGFIFQWNAWPRAPHLCLALAAVFCLALQVSGAEPDGKPSEKPAPDAPLENPAEEISPEQQELEKRFATEMSGAALVGHYTLHDNAGAGKGTISPKKERYAITKVTKLKGKSWLFDVRITYGAHDVTLPLTLAVEWAGDTPVITLTDLAIPGLGTYTSRVLIYRGQYAGTWSGGDHGGQLFGRVEREEKTPAASDKSPQDKATQNGRK